MNDLLTMTEIKKMYPDEWVLIANPVIEDTEVVAGVIIYHAKDKRDIAAQRIDWRTNFQGATTIYTGQFPENRRFWL